MGTAISDLYCCEQKEETNNPRYEVLVQNNNYSFKNAQASDIQINDVPAILLYNPEMTELRLINPLELPNGIELDEVKEPHNVNQINSITFLAKYLEAAEKLKLSLEKTNSINFEKIQKNLNEASARTQVLKH